MATPPNNLPSNPSEQNTLGSNSSLPIHNSIPTHVLLDEPSDSRTQNEVIADSKITPIPLKKRKAPLVISEKSVQMCIDEMNSKNPNDQPKLELTEPAVKLVQTEVTYKLFYILRECKKVLIRSRSNVLTEESVRQVCAEYFGTFYGNKLWPIFCLKQDNNDSNPENRVWMRKQNNVNLAGSIRHPKFCDPSYINKRIAVKPNKNILSLQDLMKVSEEIYEYNEPVKINETSLSSPQYITKIFFQSLKNDQVTLRSLFPKNNSNDDNNVIHTSTLDSFMDNSQTNPEPSTSKPVFTNITNKLNEKM